jgi:hypothetical protein
MQSCWMLYKIMPSMQEQFRQCHFVLSACFNPVLMIKKKKHLALRKQKWLLLPENIGSTIKGQ